jgi:hypothetical protein
MKHNDEIEMGLPLASDETTPVHLLFSVLPGCLHDIFHLTFLIVFFNSDHVLFEGIKAIEIRLKWTSNSIWSHFIPPNNFLIS